jgi:hypothetical protein
MLGELRADRLSGQSPACLDVVAEESRAISCVSIPADPRCWLRGPVMETRPSISKGQRRTQSVRTATAKEPIAAETWAKRWHPGVWSRRTVSGGQQDRSSMS